ncbi:MAG TPA: PEGA domain-containing protein [Kofleriaceae bacterium]|nr:PEGA domain-containing protein [Kofleriaceae bacterium]
MMLLFALTGLATAQSPALAEQLFNEARELAKANRWAEACPKFEASLRYDPVLGTRLNLATCYEHVGKLASAWGLYRESIELAKKAGDAKRADYAQKQATALEPRLPKLVISAPASPPAGFVVRRDDAPITAGELGLALYVDPGAHEVSASAPGFETFTKTITVDEGKTETLALPALSAKPVVEPLKPPPEPVARASEPVILPSRTRRYVGIGVGAAGVVAAGVGLVFGAKARSTYSDAEALCGKELVCSPQNFDEGTRLYRDARSSATASTMLVIAGGAAIVAGAIVFVTAPRANERATAQLVPVIQSRGAGLGLVGRF